MAITKLPYDVQPAFNEVTVIDDANTTLDVVSVAPSPIETITLRHILANGGSRFDLKGFLSKLFYDGKTQVTTTAGWSPWAFNDGRLLATYRIGADTTPYYVLNAVKQLGESLDLVSDEASPVLSGRAKLDEPKTRIPCYDGYPVGVSLMFRSMYEVDFTNAMRLTVQVTTGQTVRFPFLSDKGLVLTDGVMYETKGTASSTAWVQHTYATAGTYEVQFLPGSRGSLDLQSSTWSNYFTVFRTALRTIENFGKNLGVVKFYNCSNLTTVAGVAGIGGVTTLEYLFGACSKLTSIPANFFSGLEDPTAITTISSMFEECSSLASIPSGLFAPLTEITTAERAFASCGALTSVPSDLFRYQHRIYTVANIFYQCTALASIPADLFRYCFVDWAGPNAINFGLAFHGTKITTIPTTLFSYIPTAAIGVSLSQTFMNCTVLTAIPATLLNKFVGYTSINVSSMFLGCSSVTSIPATLFNGLVNLTSVSNTFRGCTAVKSVPANLFNGLIKITSVSGCFGSTGITTLPAGLFTGLVALTDASSLVESCVNLTSVPETLFNIAGNPVTNISYLFSGCTGGLTIPENFFTYLSKVTTCRYIFNNIANLRNVPSNMFRSMSLCRNIDYIFYTARAQDLNVLPANLFDGCSHITSMSNAFNASGQTSGVEWVVPEGFLDGLINVTTITWAFSGLQGALKTIPAGFLSKMTKLTNASYAFFGNNDASGPKGELLAIPADIFENNKLITTFAYCFQYQRKATGPTPVDSSGFELWQRAGKTDYPATITGASCFGSCNGLSNYSSVPSTWR